MNIREQSPLPRPVIKCYQSLSLAIAKALLKEESNSNYLSEQARILIDYVCEQHDTADKDKNAAYELAFADVFKKSLLAREFQEIYNSLKKHGVVQMAINNCAMLSYCLPHLAYKVTDKCEQTQFVEVIFDAIKYLKPYFGLLLLTPKEILLESLPVNCNFYTHRLIGMYNPRFCLARYAAELDVPIDEVYSIVNHLIHWAKVKIVYPINETNMYVIHPNCSFSTGSKLSEEFTEMFLRDALDEQSDESFHSILSQFSLAKPIVQHLDPKLPKETHIALIDQVIWLLQRNVLLQLHSFIFLLPKKAEHQRLNEQYSKISEMSFDEEIESSVIGSRNGAGAGSEHSNDTETTEQIDLSAVYDEYRYLFTHYGINEKEQQYIFKAFEQKSESDIKRFVQLMPYCNGLFSLEAIMYYEQINRSELLTFLDKFKDLLAVSFYEDPNHILRINARIV